MGGEEGEACDGQAFHPRGSIVLLYALSIRFSRQCRLVSLGKSLTFSKLLAIHVSCSIRKLHCPHCGT